jgi:N-glycosylase/DNA lyase
MNTGPTAIEAAVRSICPDVQRRVANGRGRADERGLWWELSCCILGSQVPYGMAAAAADVLDGSRVLLEPGTRAETQELVEDLLRRPLLVEGRHRLYRFPSARADQLARTHEVIHRESGLSALLSGFVNADRARIWLVANAPGLGPKQASMLLRNAGISYDLAVIDRHVLEYMSLAGIEQPGRSTVASLAGYGRAEGSLRRHAESAGCLVGVMDWAIWIVMRVAKQMRAVPA